MESNLILKVRWKNPFVAKLLQLYGDFIPQVYHKLGCEMCIEKVMDGALVFWKTVADFVKFHQLMALLSFHKPPRVTTPRNRPEHIELYVEVVRLPPGVTADDLIPGVAKAYQKVSNEIELERLSDTSAVIHFGDISNVEAIFKLLKQFWDQNRGDASVNVPKREEVAKLFENIPL